jgi:Mg2+/Co2+ transporter CorC
MEHNSRSGRLPASGENIFISTSKFEIGKAKKKESKVKRCRST